MKLNKKEVEGICFDGLSQDLTNHREQIKKLKNDANERFWHGIECEDEIRIRILLEQHESIDDVNDGYFICDGFHH